MIRHLALVALVAGCTAKPPPPCVCAPPIIVQAPPAAAVGPTFSDEARDTELQAMRYVLAPNSRPDAADRLAAMKIGLDIARKGGDGPRAHRALRLMQDYLKQVQPKS